MKSSLQIARIYGIPIQLHWTFLLIIAWIIYVVLTRSGYWDWHSLGWTSLSVLVLFLCVVLHELGHALTARRYGVSTRNILLLPIGGLAVLERLPEKPIQELWVALAGPLVNIGLAVICAPLLLLLPGEKLRQIIGVVFRSEGNFFAYGIHPWEWFVFGLVSLNLVVAVFNLLPAFPMDGGRILRALLSIPLARIRATRIATLLGQFFAVFLLAVAWQQENWAAGIVGVFIYFHASTEYRSARQQHVLDDLSVRDAVRTQYTRLYDEDQMERAHQLMRTNEEHYFLIFDRWHTLLGVLDREAIQRAAKARQLQDPIRDWFSSAFQYVQENDPLSLALEVLEKQEAGILPVCNPYGRVVGLIDHTGLNELARRKGAG